MNETQWLILVGIVAPFVIQVIKAIYNQVKGAPMSDAAALNTTYVVAIIAAAVGKWLAGDTFIPPGGDLSIVIPTLLGEIGIVLAAATVVFKSLMSSSTGVIPKLVNK